MVNNQQKMDLFDEKKKYIKGTLIVMIFHNEKNLYSVARIRVKDTNENYEEKEVVVTGHFPYIHQEEAYVFFGRFVDHPKFGKQYQVEQFRKDLPETKEGIIQYLSSDLFKGIGKKTAQKIVDKLGSKTISIILENPDNLDDVPGLSKDKAKDLYETLMEHQGLEQIMISLSNYGFGPQLSMKIYQMYLDETLDVIQQNPYQLVEDIEGIGFGRADELGNALGISGKHPDRIRAGALYLLTQQSIQEGHVYLPLKDLILNIKNLLEKNQQVEILEANISTEIIALSEEGKIIIEEDRAYEPSLYFAEKGFVTSIKRLMGQQEYDNQFPESEFLKALGSLEESLDVQYAASQREAINTAISSPMMILTGGPGTGKTTVIRGIVEIYAELHGCSLDPAEYKGDSPFPVLLVAPTGRAAKRMSESTGLPAFTIHRLLGWNGVDGFDHDEDQPIEGKLLIVDEFSMVDVWLANQLFKSLPPSIQVVIVGDEDQLPSVGPGQVLKDLLEANVVPTVQLTDIYRQSEGSSIIELAHEIKKGIVPSNIKESKQDRAFFPGNQDQVLDLVQSICANAIKKGYTARDVQVLAPMYKGPAGIDRLNRMLQQLFNPSSEGKREIKFGDHIYRVGDKVLQLINKPEDHVFNGDIGEIISIIYARENVDDEDQIIISFEGNEVSYIRQDLNQIMHAYCCSIHKSQGSEFPIVILPIVRSYYRMLRRNLIYTAITRSKEYLILCGELSAFKYGIEQNDDRLRLTTLSVKLKESLHPNLNKESDFEEDDDNLSPYDFMD